jgi:hypothetical protein
MIVCDKSVRLARKGEVTISSERKQNCGWQYLYSLGANNVNRTLVFLLYQWRYTQIGSDIQDVKSARGVRNLESL